jgi:hypothetical protein
MGDNWYPISCIPGTLIPGWARRKELSGTPLDDPVNGAEAKSAQLPRLVNLRDNKYEYK